jgi:histidine ammonia-lyase
MGMTSGLKLGQSADLARMVVAIELLAAMRALDLRGDTSTAVLEEARERFRVRVPAWREDCVLSVWMEEAARFLADDGWRDQVAGQVAVEEAGR